MEVIMSSKGQFLNAIMIIVVAVIISFAVVVSGAPEFFYGLFGAPKAKSDNSNNNIGPLEERLAELENKSEKQNQPVGNDSGLHDQISALKVDNKNLENKVAALEKEIDELKKAKAAAKVDPKAVNVPKDFDSQWRSMWERKQDEIKKQEKADRHQ